MVLTYPSLPGGLDATAGFHCGNNGFWAFVARAGDADRPRRIGALMNLTADDPLAKIEVASVGGELEKRGWTCPSSNASGQSEQCWNGGSPPWKFAII